MRMALEEFYKCILLGSILMLCAAAVNLICYFSTMEQYSELAGRPPPHPGVLRFAQSAVAIPILMKRRGKWAWGGGGSEWGRGWSIDSARGGEKKKVQKTIWRSILFCSAWPLCQEMIWVLVIFHKSMWLHKKVDAKQRQMVADGGGWKKVAGKPGNLYCRTGVKITEHSLSQWAKFQRCKVEGD